MKKNRLKFVTNNFKNKRKRFKLIQFFPLWYFELSHLSWESRSWWKLGSGTMILFSRRVEVTGNFLLFWKLENPRDWNTRPSTFPLFVDSSFRLFLLKIQACQENTNMSRKYKHVKKIQACQEKCFYLFYVYDLLPEISIRCQYFIKNNIVLFPVRYWTEV